MANPVLYHCSHGAPLPDRPPSLDPTLVDFNFKPLPSLFFCEECDAIRCERCTTGEVSCYFCPNCLFEVTAASVRAERNRCARNCFLCPSCDHTLSIVASDPPEAALADLKAPPSSIGESPYYLSCTFCRWDSKEVGITFEKPTGLALQLQKQEEQEPDRLELEHLREHFEPFLKAQLAQQQLPQTTSSHASAARSAASAALLKDVPGLSSTSRYNSVLPSTKMSSSRSHAHLSSSAAEPKDELAPYTALQSHAKLSSNAKGKQAMRDSDLVSFLRDPPGGIEATSPVSKRWAESWHQPLPRSALKPQRVPLRSKPTRRCPTCTHILIRPEQKAQSTRFKIKLMANVFLPQMELTRRSALGSLLPSRLTAAAAAGRRAGPRGSVIGAAGGAGKDGEEEALRPGRTYTFELGFSNPLYEPITVRISAPQSPTLTSAEGEAQGPPPFSIALPAPTFTIAAYAEAWEYDDDEDDDLMQDPGAGDSKRSRLSMGGSSSRHRNAPGVLEKKANRTTVAIELTIGRDFLGPLKSPLLVTYTYQADDPDGPSASEAPKAGKGATSAPGAAEDKTFTFWTALSFGNVVARPPGVGVGPRGSVVGLRESARASVVPSAS